MRDPVKYPKIVLLDSSGHYPQRYVQVTEEEAADLKKNWMKYSGSFGAFDNLDYLQRGPSRKERELKRKEVDQLPKDIAQYCEYC